MKLTNSQHRYIKALLRNRDAGSTLGTWLQARWKSWAVLAIIYGLGALMFAPISLDISWLCFGLWLGEFFADIARFKAARRMWPVTKQIIDWKRDLSRA